MRSANSLRRSLAVGAFAVIGSATAFLIGAQVGSSLDHQTRSVSVAKVPVQQMQQMVQDQSPPPPPAEVARR
jgi:hypothetical protein